MIYQALPGTGAITAPSNTPVLESRGISVLSNLSRRGVVPQFEIGPVAQALQSREWQLACGD